MDDEIKYRGKVITPNDIAFIRKLIADNPNDSRRKLSCKLCQAWKWVQENGALRDIICRGMMLELHRSGYITLPAKKQSPVNPFLQRKKVKQIDIDQTPIESTVAGLQPLTFMQVRRSKHENLCNSLIAQYHYLGYTRPVGEHLKYVIFSGKRPIACLIWSSAPYHIGCRDKFIGWDKTVRKKNLSLLAYNSRFLILPWVKAHCLASHLLGRMAAILPRDWKAVYNHPIYYLETFVDTERYTGTCYKAANWICLGETTGIGIKEKKHRITRSIKTVWGYPLRPDFRTYLCSLPN